MELNVRSLLGAVRLRAVPEHWTVEDLKASLHEGYPSLQIPEPKHQNLVHGGRLLSTGLLSTSGVASGATVVLLHTAPPPKTTLPPTTPAPSAMDIRAAIFEEARRRGIEHKLRDEAPVHSHASLNLPHDLMDMDNQLMGLIEALEGRLGLLRQGARGPNYSGRALDAAVEAGLLSAPGDARAGAAVPQASEPIPDIQPPEPDAEHITQLCDMGFPEPVVRKALVLHRNRVPEAVEWLLIHSEDADAGEPVTQEQLRRIYGAPQTRASAIALRGAAVEGPATPAAAASTVASALRELQMSLLQAVGIDADSAQGLLDRASDVPGTAPGAAAATATANQAQAQHAGDPLETFRRHLQEQLGEARHDDLDAAANSLAELFPLEALMNLGAGHDDDDDEHHDGEEENEEEEEEGDEEEGDEEEEEEDAQGQGGAVMPDSLRF